MGRIQPFIFILLISILSGNAFSQGFSLLPITHNVELMKQEKYQLRSTQSIDSTFIFTVDTISLPLFDDFSTNRIQQYNPNFTDPDVTSILYYRLLDQTNTPLPGNASYSTQQTFRRTYDTNTGTNTTTNFPSITVLDGDLSQYPVEYQTRAAYPPYYIYDTIGVADTPDTIWIVGPNLVQDSARQFFAHASTPGTYWLDDYAYHNYRFAKDPWSIGVMTFDGIDEKGHPYQIGTTLRGVADYLTSKPINLNGSSPADSIYLTFLYQAQGLGETPESNDSLILEFYDKVSNKWYWQWSVNGSTMNNFKVVNIPVKDPIYFNDAFQFRFKNFGDLSGALDHFHLDYVNLRNFSGYQDTLIEDFALVYPTVTLLKDYTSIPWDHYQANPTGKMSTEVPLAVRNSYLNGGANITSAGGGRIEISYNNTLEGTVNLNGQAIVNFDPVNQPIPDYQPRTTYHSTHDVASAYQFDHTKAGTQQRFTVKTIVSVPVGSNYLPNDTTYSEQFFSNYYSYDDGSAELAFGTTGAQSRLAIKYNTYEPDSIIGAYIHFVPTVNDVTNKLFQLTIWNDNGGKPGSIIYQDNNLTLRQPSYGYGRNDFMKLMTDDTTKVPVSGTFYIGWRQIDPVNLGAGFDRNTDHGDKIYYSLDNGATWEQPNIEGSVMIRPIFSTSLDPELGIKEIAIEKPTITIFPNPSNGLFNIQSSNGTIGTVSVYSSMGQLIQQTTESTIDLSNQPEGIYLIKTTSDLSKTYKVVKTQ